MMIKAHFLRRYLLYPLFLLLTSCSSADEPNFTEHGTASFYADFFEGRPTANGEVFSQDSLTAAHKYLPFNTEVKVTDRQTGQSVTVRINDRGPFVDDRIIDFSRASKREIGLEEDEGLAEVTLSAHIDQHLADSLRKKLETAE